MTEQLKSAIFTAVGRGESQEAVRLLKRAIEQGDEEAKRLYAALTAAGAGSVASSITHYLCIVPPSAFAEWKRTGRGPVGIALHPVEGKGIWESQMGIAPGSNEVHVLAAPSGTGGDNSNVAAISSDELEPPLATLRLGRSSGHAFFVRAVLIEDPPSTVTRFILGVAYRSPKFHITNGPVPAEVSAAATSGPSTRPRRFWQFWR